MNYLNEQSCEAVLLKIVTTFGTGEFSRDRYVFDSITCLPFGMKAERISSIRLLNEIQNISLFWIVFDPNLKNRGPAISLLRHFDIEEYVPGLAVAKSELSNALNADFIECDFYLSLPSGELLGVASHEDEIKEGKRILWRPIWLDEKRKGAPTSK